MAAQASTPLRPIDFYRRNYVFLPTPSQLTPDMKPMILGDRENPLCRFCGQTKSETSFRNRAHAIPVSLGNKCLFSAYECDECNQYFGENIENHLGNWSIVRRTLSGIRGRRKVPTLKSGGHEPLWKITRDASGLRYKEYKDCSALEIDKEGNSVTFQLAGGSYTPIAVFKAFTKIGLTLLPNGEIDSFSETLSWVRNPDYSSGFVKHCSIIYTFVPGPMPSDIIIPRLLRRKAQSSDVPYAFLILGYGNCLVQVWLPCRERDESIWNTTLDIPPFPPVIVPKSTIYGKPTSRVLDLSGREQVKDESKSHKFEFESIETKD